MKITTLLLLATLATTAAQAQDVFAVQQQQRAAQDAQNAAAVIAANQQQMDFYLAERLREEVAGLRSAIQAQKAKAYSDEEESFLDPYQQMVEREVIANPLIYRSEPAPVSQSTGTIYPGSSTYYPVPANNPKRSDSGFMPKRRFY